MNLGIHYMVQKICYLIPKWTTNYPIMHTFSDTPLLKKWLHPKNISAEITSDFSISIGNIKVL